MARVQRTVVALAGLVCAGMALVPPWQFNFESQLDARAHLKMDLGSRQFAGYGFIFIEAAESWSPMGTGDGLGGETVATIDWERLSLQWLAVLLVAAAALAIVPNRVNKGKERDP